MYCLYNGVYMILIYDFITNASSHFLMKDD